MEHIGVVENICGSCLRIRITQKSACALCDAKRLCAAAESKDKIIEINDSALSLSYQVGDRVMITGKTSMGLWAVLWAFIVPSVLLIISLFVFMAWIGDELYTASLSLFILMLYYFILWLNKAAIKRNFSFLIRPVNI